MIEKLSHEQIVARQLAGLGVSRSSLAVILEDIRSLNNVGSIFRTADGAGIEKLWLCGYTGYPPQSGIAKTSLGAEESVPWEYRSSSVEVARQLKQEGYRIVLLEQARDSYKIGTFSPSGKTCLVLGNEIEGVSSQLCAMADDALEIPMRGIKNSLNVSVAFGIAAYFLTVNPQAESRRPG
jgi:tRNA G18 (ribose-2'-O)-methylase SpoU